MKKIVILILGLIFMDSESNAMGARLEGSIKCEGTLKGSWDNSKESKGGSKSGIKSNSKGVSKGTTKSK